MLHIPTTKFLFLKLTRLCCCHVLYCFSVKQVRAYYGQNLAMKFI